MIGKRKKSVMEKILETLRNPTIFNGLGVLAYLWISLTALHTESWPVPKIIFTALSMALIATIVGWLNYFAWRNPRFLAYGPQEYIRESELAHQRHMEGK
jgi:hypothetical protein